MILKELISFINAFPGKSDRSFRAHFGLILCSHACILHRALLTASQRLRKAVHLLWQEKPQESQLPKG